MNTSRRKTNSCSQRPLKRRRTSPFRCHPRSRELFSYGWSNRLSVSREGMKVSLLPAFLTSLSRSRKAWGIGGIKLRILANPATDTL